MPFEERLNKPVAYGRAATTVPSGKTNRRGHHSLPSRRSCRRQPNAEFRPVLLPNAKLNKKRKERCPGYGQFVKTPGSGRDTAAQERDIPGQSTILEKIRKIIGSFVAATKEKTMKNEHEKLKEEALRYHSEGRPGKLEVIPIKPYSSQKDLSLAYSPGVAYPCLEIEKNPDDAYKYTSKTNLVAVVSNGTAVLGLGDIGALAGKPVMEGKGLLFKTFADIDVFDIEVDTRDVEEFIRTVKNISPTFGGINLEDIKAPECFLIEERLRDELDIPVMHDDQHGTAIISSAALLNALEVAGKEIGDVRVVVNGAGAAAISCSRMYLTLGVKPENLVMCDSKGVIRRDRPGLGGMKARFATDRDVHTLEEALKGADVFLGLSVADVLTPDMVRSMAANPIVFALANPHPEISYERATASRSDIIFATGRSDYPNQVNNVLGFPYIFRGALDVRARKINEEMKVAAVHALAALAKEHVPDMVLTAYNKEHIEFGREYLIPKALDPRLITEVTCAVAQAAMDSGVARQPIANWHAYRAALVCRTKVVHRLAMMAAAGGMECEIPNGR